MVGITQSPTMERDLIDKATYNPSTTTANHYFTNSNRFLLSILIIQFKVLHKIVSMKMNFTLLRIC